MDPVTLVLALTFGITFVLLLLKNIGESMIATWRGTTPPRIARKAARQKLRQKYGAPTIAEAFAARVAHRIENPPDRRWAAKLREVLAEIVEDALSEAQVRHQRAYAARQARGGWQVRTGGPAPRPAEPTGPPPPEPDDDVLDMELCYCQRGYVSATDEMCEQCERERGPSPYGWQCRCQLSFVDGPNQLCAACAHDEAFASSPDPEPVPEPGPRPEQHTTKGPSMGQAAMHTVSGDIHDPTTSLRFADECRGVNDAVVGELDTLAANLQRMGVGSGLLDEVRVLADAGRRYSRSTSESMRKYAEHVVSQDAIAGDDDVKDTVRRTYLDTRGTPGAGRGDGGTKATISAADCDNPAAGARFMDGVATIYVALHGEADLAHGNHQRDGVSGAPLQFLAEQRDHASLIADQAEKSAQRFRAHMRRQRDTVGKDESLHGTQRGNYFDQAKV